MTEKTAGFVNSCGYGSVKTDRTDPGNHAIMKKDS